jgi:CheY-like chemotaxis protein
MMRNIFNTQYLGKKRVLIVDNVMDHAQLLATILEMEGYQVETAESGHTAITKVEANPPQVVLLDLMMPEINGVQVASWIRQNQPHVAVIIVTSDYELEELPCEVKIDGFISKPIDFDQAVNTVQAVFKKNNSFESVV